MEKTKPGQEVSLKVKRGDAELQLRLQLVLFVDEDEEFSGDLSERRSGFPAVFAHDTAIIPAACGSPLLDLEGKVVGLNIARAGRVTTYAIPADELNKIVPRLLQEAKKEQRKLAKREAAKSAGVIGSKATEASKPTPASQSSKSDTKPVAPAPAPQAP
jgi:S1-C subfamily serine protease